MILINGVEILTVHDSSISWEGAKDTITRSFSFSFVCNPQFEDLPKYSCAVGDKVEWIENGKTLFLGYVDEVDFSTDDDTVPVSCYDFACRLGKSKFVGRMRGTLNQLANNICGSFGLKNGINVNNTHVHNIVSDGDLTYFDVLKTACDTMFDRYTLYMDADTLKLAENDIVAEFTIGKDIRSSNFSQSISDMVTKVLVIDNDGNLLNSVVDKKNLEKYGLFQETYNYNKDVTNNLAEARKKLKGVENKATIVVNNNNDCISGRLIKVFEPLNNFVGTFEIETDSHVIGTDNVMTLEIKLVEGA